MHVSRRPIHPPLLLLALIACGPTSCRTPREPVADAPRPAPRQCCETAPVRPAGGHYVPPPFVPLATERRAVRCLGRRYDLTGIVPAPTVGQRPLLQHAAVLLDGKPLEPPRPAWRVRTPAVAVAERAWRAGSVRVALRQTVEYDGFVTADLTLSPAADAADVQSLTLRLAYRPEASVLYHIPVFRPTWAGLWPREMKIDKPIVGVWGGDDQAGFASYVATFRHWRNPKTKVALSKGDDGVGVVEYRVIAQPTVLRAPVTYRFGFIATPVRPPERRHWQPFSLPPVRDVARLCPRVTLWGALSDHYATFRTNKPEHEARKLDAMRDARSKARQVLAYTTYAHVEEGAVAVPKEWALADTKGRVRAHSIGGAQAHLNRVFLCPGSRAWVDWKVADLEAAVERYGVDGFYVDTSYIILPCANALHGHGWVDADGQRQADYLTWSMREVWRRAYEMLCRRKGRAAIYAHHKSGCPSALAAFTSAFCDGEQYTGQSIRNCTLNAFRAENAGRNQGPLALFLDQYYRSANYGLREKAEHHNPAESAMLSLLHDVLPMGYPGLHPIRELFALRDDLGIADAAWTPYYAPHAWRAEGAKGVVASAYRTKRGDTLLVVGNTTYKPARARLIGPEDAQQGRTFVAIDVLARMGRGSAYTPGYRWEQADPDAIEVAARSFALFAFIREPHALPRFAAQHGFIRRAQPVKRRRPVPKGARLVSDFDDPDWVMANDDGELALADREPVDTARALRVLAKPRHRAAALLRHYTTPQDWRAFGAVTFWVRPDKPLPVRCFDVRLRNSGKYTPPAALASHKQDAVLPDGKWTQLRYTLGDIPRNHVQVLRVYYHRAELCSGPFDLDEVLIHAAAAPASATGNKPTGGTEDKGVPD